MQKTNSTEIDKLTVVVGYFNTPLGVNYKHVDRKSPTYRTEQYH